MSFIAVTTNSPENTNNVIITTVAIPDDIKLVTTNNGLMANRITSIGTFAASNVIINIKTNIKKVTK